MSLGFLLLYSFTYFTIQSITLYHIIQKYNKEKEEMKHKLKFKYY